MECVIVLMTHSSYVDICDNFVSLLHKNWPDCPFKVVGAVIGENRCIQGIDTIYVDTNEKLTDCIKAVMKEHEADYYMCFLGDAFISSRVCNDQVFALLNEIKEKEANYCKIIPMKKDSNNHYPNNIRNIRKKDVYAHTFVAFIATRIFVETELIGTTDFEFEKKYLEIAASSMDNGVFPDHFVVVKNIFHIIPAIVKGKWDRLALKSLEHNNPEIFFSNRDKLGLRDQCKLIVISMIEGMVPSKSRKKLKKFFSSIGIKFVTDK